MLTWKRFFATLRMTLQAWKPATTRIVLSIIQYISYFVNKIYEHLFVKNALKIFLKIEKPSFNFKKIVVYY